MKDRGPATSEPLTILQWMAPDMARAGLLQNEEWVPGHCERACRLYPNQGVHVAATFLAALHKHSIDYLEQAPVLALAASYGTSARRRQDRQWIARKFGPLAERGARLRDLLAAYELPLPLRKIVPLSVRPGLYPVIAELTKLNPSTLSQIIPATPAVQARWLDRLGRWSKHLTHRSRHTPALFEWAAIALSQTDDVERLDEVADFLSEPARFLNGRWTWEKAASESEVWHDAIAEMMLTAKHGATIDHEVSYAPFPDIAEVGGFTFHALRSGRALFNEGRKMRHCVGSYVADVLKGLSRLYSIQHDGKRLATAQFVDRKCVQAKGPCNRSVGPLISKAIELFLKRVPAA